MMDLGSGKGVFLVEKLLHEFRKRIFSAASFMSCGAVVILKRGSFYRSVKTTFLGVRLQSYTTQCFVHILLFVKKNE